MGSRETAPAGRRVIATAVDYTVVAPWLAILGIVGYGLRRAGVATELPHTSTGRLGAQFVVLLLLTVPFTLWLAWWEANRHATPGKTLLHLRVDAHVGVI